MTTTLAGGDFTASTGTRLSNYTLPTRASGAGTIDPKRLGLSGLRASDKTYDGTTAVTITAYGSLVGIVGGDRVTLATGGASAAFTNPDVGHSKTVVVSGLTLGGASASDYRLFTPQTRTADILPAPNSGGSATAERQMSGGHAVPVDGPSPNLAPRRFIYTAQDKPASVTLTTAHGAVSPPAVSCHGATGFDPFALPGSKGLCHGG